MPSARAEELRRIAAKLGFVKDRTRGSHERWRHKDGRATTIPIHGGRQIGSPLLNRILDQIGIDMKTFEALR